MAAPINWTPEIDGTIRAMRRAGSSYNHIAAHLNISVWTVVKRGQRLGLHEPKAPNLAGAAELERAIAASRQSAPSEAVRGFDPLPPGHPVSWRECLGMTEEYPR